MTSRECITSLKPRRKLGRCLNSFVELPHLVLWRSLTHKRKVILFAMNNLAAHTTQATGNRHTSLNDMFLIVNISRRGLHTKTWQSYVKKTPVPAANCVDWNLASECWWSVCKLYSKLSLSNLENIKASCTSTSAPWLNCSWDLF